MPHHVITLLERRAVSKPQVMHQTSQAYLDICHDALC